MEVTFVDFGRVLLALLLAAAGSWTSWCIAARMLHGADASVRACATALTWLWLSTALFAGLSSLGAFTPLVAAIAWCGAAIVAQVLARSHDPWRH